ncbi:MAG: prephenate dehydratase [Minwuia sp.]|uniref:prephenate dehydratase n=1 Tax=Minwuia sp. TaxID=2493630 RepID=UPI003A8AB880
MNMQLSPKTVAFQGVPGAYSNLACREVFPGAEAIACQTFQAAFEAVRSGAADVGMIPIENTLGGRVAGIHSLLPNAGLYMIGEHFQRVEHMLLAPKGAELEKLKRVYSHEQALAQCQDLIRNLGLEAIVHADTAGAAQEIAERGDPTEAAIASSLAAEIYGLEPMRSRIEDKIGNTTRFVIMARQRMDPPPTEDSIMSLLFQVRSVPASLYKALGGFATNGVNVVKLESYIVDMSFTVAQFYAEIEGHPATREVDRALEEVRFFSTNVKELGVYPAHPFRRHG